jgi:hypothetical protein
VLTLRRNLIALIGAVAVLSAVFLTGAAQAQTTPTVPGYGSPVPPCAVGPINAGTLSVGQTAVFLLCGPFTGTVTVKVNGTTTFTNKQPSSGQVRVTVTRTSATSAAVDDPFNVATVCGSNTVTGSDAAATATGTFTILCAAPASSGGLAFTGANVVLGLIVAMVLIVLGALLVMFQRRRRQTI